MNEEMLEKARAAQSPEEFSDDEIDASGGFSDINKVRRIVIPLHICGNFQRISPENRQQEIEKRGSFYCEDRDRDGCGTCIHLVLEYGIGFCGLT